METLQPTKQNGEDAINNNHQVSNNELPTIEDKNKQIHSQIKIHNEHLNNITKIEKYKKPLNITCTREQAINIGKSKNEVTKQNTFL